MQTKLPINGTIQHPDLAEALRGESGTFFCQQGGEERVRVRRSEQDKLRTGDVVTERFVIERGDKQIGEFSRTAIADNLSAGIFFKDDWFWSAAAQAWQPLGALEL